MSNPERYEDQAENEVSSELKESDEFREKAVEYLENSEGQRSFVQTLKSFAAWLKQQLADLD
jgi:phosphorylcholine metabolism protein LicD